MRLPGAPSDAQRPHAAQGPIAVGDGAHPPVSGQGRLQGSGRAVPVAVSGGRAGGFFTGECLCGQAAGPGEFRGRGVDRVRVGGDHAVDQARHIGSAQR